MKKILLLLAEGFEVYEASAFIDVFGWNNINGSKDTKLFTCARRKHIKSTFSLSIEVEKTLDKINVDEFDALAVPGGFEIYGFYNDAYSPEFSEVIAEFDRQKKPIASICVGALSLGKSGILKQRKATTYNIINNKRIDQLSAFGAHVTNAPIVTDKNVTTSFGPNTAIDVAFKLLEQLTSKENCKYIREIMGFE